MARPSSQLPFNLDRETEASLRRQFAVPAVGVLPSAMVGAGVAGGLAGSAGGGFRLDFQLGFSLRQAAGLALAATLWMGAGYLFFDHFDRPSRTASAPTARLGLGIAPDTPLGNLLETYDTARNNAVGDDESADPEQEALWQELKAQLVARRGETIAPYLDRLRESDQPIELLAVQGMADNAADGTLLVTARVGDVVSAALIDSEISHNEQYRIGMPGVVEVASPETTRPQLFQTKFPDGQAFEVVAAAEPLLVPLLLPDSEVQSSLPLERGRNRSVQAVAAPPPLRP